jgi:hypothetical protein
MIGYVLAAIIGFVLLALVFAAMGKGRARPAGRNAPRADSQPAADEPTPDRSATASGREIDAARRHTPPA